MTRRKEKVAGAEAAKNVSCCVEEGSLDRKEYIKKMKYCKMWFEGEKRKAIKKGMNEGESRSVVTISLSGSESRIRKTDSKHVLQVRSNTEHRTPNTEHCR